MEDKVARAATLAFNKLPRGCHPDEAREWTIYSAICEESPTDFKIVSAGTGTKCLSQSEMSQRGDLLHDSHAEIIAIRSFKRYLMNELGNHIRSPDNPSKIFDGSLSAGFQVKSQYKYHLYTTHPPCGDATIFPVGRENEDGGDGPPASKRVKVVEDRSFTGAKLIDPDKTDLLAQDEGAVRIKPGRGERTLSMSCSDKLAKVLVMGLQGCLLTSLLAKPIYLDSIILSKNSGYHRASLERALHQRFVFSALESSKFHLSIPKVIESTVDYAYAKDKDKSPCPKSVIWCCVKEKPLEISVDGRRQGVAKKDIARPSSRLKICRVELFREFTSLLQLKLQDDFESLSYAEIKAKHCPEYMSCWQSLKRDYFRKWTEKPANLQSFRNEEQKLAVKQ